MPRVKTISVPASPTSSINLTHHAGNADRGSPNPVYEEIPAVDPVSKIPYRQHTFADGTVGAPSWSPVDHDTTDPAQSNRSWEATVKQLNPAGDPTHPKKARENFNAASLLKQPRRKVESRAPTQPKNPQAPIKPAGTFVADAD